MKETTLGHQENKMGVMPISKLLISMSIPMMASMLVQALYNIVDSIFVSQISENALTAVSLAFPVQNLMIAFGASTRTGDNSLLSKSHGDMISQATGAIVNIILDPILIFGLLGFPALGVKGAAIATVIGQTSGMLVALWFNLRKNHEIRIMFRQFRPNLEIIKKIYAVGIPSTLMISIGSIMN